MTAAAGTAVRVDRALAALRAGRPVLVADAGDRENEVDAIVSAATVDEQWLAWIIRHSSGYLCAPMPADRAADLDLPPMVANSQDPRGTAYTISVDAATGVTTGISAADRTRTLHVLADPAATAADLIRPGHVLPLRARPGGVLERAGHTEAAVDLCRLAGLAPVAAIAELVADDGPMMRLPEAEQLAAEHDLVLLTVADIAAALRDVAAAGAGSETAPAPRVRRAAVADLPTGAGRFRIHGYRDLRTGAEHVALVAPRVDGAVPVVRVHSECLTGDAFGSSRCDCGAQLDAAMRAAASRGGAVVYLRGHEGRGIGLLAKIAAYSLQDEGLDTVAANLELGWPADDREYGAAAAIIEDLGLQDAVLLTNNPAKSTALRELGLPMGGVEGLEVGRTPENAAYLRTKHDLMGHTLTPPPDGTDDMERRSS